MERTSHPLRRRASVAAFPVGLGGRLAADVALFSDAGVDANSEWGVDALGLLDIDLGGASRERAQRPSFCIVLIDAVGNGQSLANRFRYLSVLSFSNCRTAPRRGGRPMETSTAFFRPRARRIRQCG